MKKTEKAIHKTEHVYVVIINTIFRRLFRSFRWACDRWRMRSNQESKISLLIMC